MKIPRINLLALMIFALALSSFVPVSIATENHSVLSKKELKALLRTAKEPSEHRKIAEYYRQESQRLTERSKYHEEMGAIYKKSPLPYEGKFPYGAVGFSHCQSWAELDRKQAQESEALASLHQEMATRAELKSATPQEVTDVPPSGQSSCSCSCCLKSGNGEQPTSATCPKTFASLGK